MAELTWQEQQEYDNFMAEINKKECESGNHQFSSLDRESGYTVFWSICVHCHKSKTELGIPF